MYLQKGKNGSWFIKFGTKFEYPGNINQEDKKTVFFEEYFWNLYTDEKINIQLVWKIDNIVDFTMAMIEFDTHSKTINSEKIKNHGEFFCYLYKEDKSNRPVITIEESGDEYDKTLDISHLDTNIFDYSVLNSYPYDTKSAYFDWLKLNKEDFYFLFDPQSNLDTVTCSIVFEKLINHLEKSDNKIYQKIFKDFNLKYFENKFPENGRKVKKTKI